MNKTEVNGVNQSKVYEYLKETCSLPTAAKFYPKNSFWDPIRPNDVAWNFEKFVVDAEGRPIFRFLSSVQPFDIREILIELFKNGKMTKQQILENQEIAKRLLAIENRYKSEY